MGKPVNITAVVELRVNLVISQKCSRLTEYLSLYIRNSTKPEKCVPVWLCKRKILKQKIKSNLHVAIFLSH